MKDIRDVNRAFSLGYKVPLSSLASGGYLTTGNAFYVHSGTGSNSYSGRRTSTPVATIDYAVGLCTASKGDVIFVMPGHAENISAATSLLLDVAGVKVIGLGEGRNRPVLTYTATAGTVEMDAANCSIENIVFLASVSAVSVGINIDAADCSLIGCEFNWDETGDDFARMVDTASVARTTIRGNKFIAEDTAGTNEGVFLNNSDDAVIEDNYFYGDFTEGAIDFETGASTNVRVVGNDIYNSDTTAGIVVDSAVSDTGIIANNRMTSLCTTATVADNAVFNPGTLLDGGGNYLSRGTDRKAYRVPVAGNAGLLEWRTARHASTVFDGATGNAHGDTAGTGNPYTIFTVTGDVVLMAIWGVCNTNIAGAGTLEVGVASNTAALIAQIANAEDLDDGDIYIDATPGVGAEATQASGSLFAINDGTDIIETVGTADITAGQVDYYAIWAPMEDGAYLA